MFDRKTMIKDLTQYELKWFLDQADDRLLNETMAFFADGGFVNWSDADLIKKYDLFIKEENADA